MRSSRLLVGAAVCVLAISLAACGSSTKSATSSTASSAPASSGGATTGTTITIRNFAFAPSTLTVKPGATVTVHNADSAAHTVTANNKGFDTGDVSPGATKTFTAPSAPGTYPYICTIHPFMHGTLVVS